MRTHTGEMEIKTFVCSQCPKAYSQAFFLDNHVKSLTDEKRFACSECSKTFNQRTHLKVHFRTHIGCLLYTSPSPRDS